MAASLYLCILCCLSASVHSEEVSEEPTCKAGEPCSSPFKTVSPYYWPHAHGHPGYYGNPPWPGPTDLKKTFKWRWNGPTGVLYSEAFNGVVIDDKKNIYVNGNDHVYKLDENGKLLWTYKTPRAAAANGPALLDGVLYGDCAEGWVYAVDMETGLEKWSRKASNHNGGEYGHISAHNGVLVTEGDFKKIPDGQAMAGNAACGTVRGLNASTGEELWAFKPDGILWDWFPQFPDDDSVIFMEQTGKLYRLELQTGALIWAAGGLERTWTDGCQFLASNGLVYSVIVDHTQGCAQSVGGVWECPGWVTAHKVSDGSVVWKSKVPKPPNTAPVVGRLGKGEKLSLVMPIGQQTGACESAAFSWFGPNSPLGKLPDGWFKLQVFKFIHHAYMKLGDDWNLLWKRTVTLDVTAMDAETGAPLWTFPAETDHFAMAPGDSHGMVTRMVAGIRMISCPTPWSAPRIGSDGTIYVASQGGVVFAIRDANGDNHIDRETEVSTYETGGVFTHIGTAHAPGMLVAVNFDSVFVFKS